MAGYQVEFANNSPNTVEVRKVDTLAVDGIVIPEDAMQFSFYESDGMSNIAPTYFVSNDPAVGTLEELQQRYPQASQMFPDLAKTHAATVFGHVSWDHPDGPQWSDSGIIPLAKGYCALVDRASGRVVWPPQA